MADPACESIQTFMNEYDKYCDYCDYAVQWLNSIAAKGLCLQGSSHYDTALSVGERAALEANVAAAQAEPILPVTVPPSN